MTTIVKDGVVEFTSAPQRRHENRHHRHQKQQHMNSSSVAREAAHELAKPNEPAQSYPLGIDQQADKTNKQSSANKTGSSLHHQLRPG